MKTEIGKRLEAAYELLNIQKQRDLVFELISKYEIDRNMSLQEIFDETSERKKRTMQPSMKSVVELIVRKAIVESI